MKRCILCVCGLVVVITPLKLMLLLHSKIFLIPNQSYFSEHSDNHGKQTYIFFDTIHLIKNIRNNLLHAKKFVFPEFSYNKNNTQLHCPQGCINWADLYNIYCKDEELT